MNFLDHEIGDEKVELEDENAFSEDSELAEMKKLIEETKKEIEQKQKIGNQVNKQLNTVPIISSAAEIDAKSIWVGNVDYGTSVYELEEHFKNCGAIVRATILHDKYSGKPKGFAYVEFVNACSVELAQTLNETILRGRQIKITAKRVNIHGLTTTNGRCRGGGERRKAGSATGRGRSRYAYDVAADAARFATHAQHQFPAGRGVGRGRSWRTSRHTPY
ncbi:hypothetical protein HELRODRAFT_63079 [Helobdella robusta]|uniref:RRM domain-containing protein n=1 Tax=Helobdella robusta TaxID=6412 RepID=T1FXA8_HELRO|nr:hypothetical protein HELRODRAFT_63079 [Helobdella robusta]ESO13081.1 hypothetical protein HELRODRAFT_63079 [Helobdella robusta]